MSCPYHGGKSGRIRYPLQHRKRSRKQWNLTTEADPLIIKQPHTRSAWERVFRIDHRTWQLIEQAGLRQSAGFQCGVDFGQQLCFETVMSSFPKAFDILRSRAFPAEGATAVGSASFAGFPATAGIAVCSAYCFQGTVHIPGYLTVHFVHST